ETRTMPSTFSVLDSFSGASFSTAAVNSGGLADVDSMLNPALGIVVNNHVVTPRPADSGTDGPNLRTGPVDVDSSGMSPGVGDPNQLAISRFVQLTATNSASGGSSHSDVSGGRLFFSSDDLNSANLVISYSGLSSPTVEILTSNVISFD